MNKHWILFLILSLVSLSGKTQVTDNLKMVWNDEFNGNSLDASKWAPAPEWPRQGGSYWSDNNYEMTGNGQVKLKVTEENGTVYCGAIRTHNKFDQKYGYFETRCKLPQIQGGWAAFWLMPYGNKPGGWGDDGTEMDVFESINGWNGKINHALHWDGYGVEHQKSSQSTSRPDLYDGQYHVFGMMWTPDEYIFYIDNVESWRTNAGGVSDVNQYLKLTLEVSGDTWAGNWNNQVTKPIDWLIDYVRVYDYHPISESVNLGFKVLKDNQTFNVGDQVQMHIAVTGTVSQIDEIKFFTQKGAEADVLRKISDITTETTYWYNWFPSEEGSYKVKAKGYKNGIYVTNVVMNITVQSQNEPFSISYASLVSGSTFQTGENLNMDINLSGDLSNVDELQFLIRKGDGEFIEQTTMSVTEASTYTYNWVSSEPGNYTLRVTAKDNASYVTHVVVNNITILEIPILKLFNTNNINSQNRALLVFPNPTNDFLTIENSSNETDYIILSLSGKFISEGKGKHINVTNLPTGTYLLKMNNLISTKFIKN
jgi:beta-glucanase (GH16 family)